MNERMPHPNFHPDAAPPTLFEAVAALPDTVREFAENLAAQVRDVMQRHGIATIAELLDPVKSNAIPLVEYQGILERLQELARAVEERKVPEKEWEKIAASLPSLFEKCIQLFQETVESSELTIGEKLATVQAIAEAGEPVLADKLYYELYLIHDIPGVPEDISLFFSLFRAYKGGSYADQSSAKLPKLLKRAHRSERMQSIDKLAFAVLLEESRTVTAIEILEDSPLSPLIKTRILFRLSALSSARAAEMIAEKEKQFSHPVPPVQEYVDFWFLRAKEAKDAGLDYQQFVDKALEDDDSPLMRAVGYARLEDWDSMRQICRQISPYTQMDDLVSLCLAAGNLTDALSIVENVGYTEVDVITNVAIAFLKFGERSQAEQLMGLVRSQTPHPSFPGRYAIACADNGIDPTPWMDLVTSAVRREENDLVRAYVRMAVPLRQFKYQARKLQQGAPRVLSRIREEIDSRFSEAKWLRYGNPLPDPEKFL